MNIDLIIGAAVAISIGGTLALAAGFIWALWPVKGTHDHYDDLDEIFK